VECKVILNDPFILDDNADPPSGRWMKLVDRELFTDMEQTIADQKERLIFLRKRLMASKATIRALQKVTVGSSAGWGLGE